MTAVYYSIGNYKTASYREANLFSRQSGLPLKKILVPIDETTPPDSARIVKVRKHFAEKRVAG